MSVKDASAVELALPSGMLGNVGNPELIGSSSTKVAIDKIASGSNVGFFRYLRLVGRP